MRSKLDDEIKRLNMIAPASWFDRIEDWRREQPNPMPSVSEAIRRLVDLGLDKPVAKPKARQHRAA
jgi:hypothetical protein